MHYFLRPDALVQEALGIVIKQKITPFGMKKLKAAGGILAGGPYKADRYMSRGTGKVQGVTIHNSADIAQAPGTTDAEQYARATWPNDNMGTARVHYWVDEQDVWQQLKDNEVGWHAGGGPRSLGQIGNDTTIAMEIIMGSGDASKDAKAEDRGARLAAILLDRHGLGVNQLYTHNHWLGLPDSIVLGRPKNCPFYILPHWQTFKARVAAYLDRLKQAPKGEAPTEVAEVFYRVQVGAYQDRGYADRLCNELRHKGYPAFVIQARRS